MKNLIQAAVVTLLAASTAQAQQAVQWRVEDGGNGHWYAVQSVPEGITWTAARDQSASAGGHLATATSAAENAFCFGLVPPTSPVWVGTPSSCDTCCGCGGPWIGGYQDPNASDYSEPTGGWRWVTDEPWEFVAWYGPVTDDGNGNREAFLHYWRSFLPGAWNDNEDLPNRSTGFIVEWDADCNGDGIVDYGQCHDGTLADYNGNNIPDCCERGESCVVGNYPVQWRAEDGGNGHWYAGIITNLAGADWTEARVLAQARGADLCIVQSTAHLDWLFSRIVRRQSLWSTSAGPWVGALQSARAPEPDGGWTWVDGTAIAPGVWSAGQPDDFRPCGGDNNRMAFWNAGAGVPRPLLEDSPGNLSSTPCVGIRTSALIEWSADCNNDGIVDYGQILTGQLADLDSNGIPDICQQPTCVDADLFRDFNVNGTDLGILLSQWGPSSPLTVSDINSDGVVNGADLGILLSFWGACP